MKNRVFLEILGKNGPKIRKNAKNEKSATNNFFELLLASHSQKIGCLAKKVEKKIGKVLKKPVFFLQISHTKRALCRKIHI